MNPSGKVMLNYGAMSGLCSFAFFLLLNFIGWNPLGQASWLGAWIPVIFICLATGHLRNKILGGFISYGQAFRIGFLTGASGAFLFALIIYIYGTVLNTDLVENYKNEIIEGLEKTKSILGESFYETSMENLEKTNMMNIASSDFFSKTLGSFVVALITAGFYKRYKLLPEPESEKE